MNRREELAARNLTQKYIDGTLPEYIADFGRQILAEGGVGKFTLREEEEVWTAEATVQGEDFQAYRPVLTVNFRDQCVDGACNCMEAFRQGVKVVSGSTGWMGEHGDEMRRLCETEGKTLFWASNFSLGVAIFSAVNKYLAKIMNDFPNYEVSMVETHHVHKLDAPSGTAAMLLDAVIDGKGDPEARPVYGRAGICGARSPHEIGVHALRGGTVAGTHTVSFFGPSEEVSLTHRAESREIFARGALAAARRLALLEQGFYTFDEVMFG